MTWLCSHAPLDAYQRISQVVSSWSLLLLLGDILCTFIIFGLLHKHLYSCMALRKKSICSCKFPCLTSHHYLGIAKQEWKWMHGKRRKRERVWNEKTEGHFISTSQEAFMFGQLVAQWLKSLLLQQCESHVVGSNLSFNSLWMWHLLVDWGWFLFGFSSFLHSLCKCCMLCEMLVCSHTPVKCFYTSFAAWKSRHINMLYSYS